MDIFDWEPIGKFDTPEQFYDFVAWIENQKTEGICKEIPVGTRYRDFSSFQEKWFLKINTNAVWRLVWPDPPFYGRFEPVDLQNPGEEYWEHSLQGRYHGRFID